MNTIIEAYLIAFFIFIHFSLLLCEQPACFFDAKPFITFLPMGIYHIVGSIFSIIPIKLEIIQLVAQFCLFGDLVLVVLILLKIVGNILRNLLLIMGITSIIMVIMYSVTNYDQAMVANTLTTIKTFIINLINNFQKSQ